MKNLFYTFIAFVICNTVLAQSQTSFQVSVTGKGQPILLIPGFTCPGSVWDETVKLLSQDYECHVFTLAGFGGVAPIKFPWLPQVNEDLKQYIITTKLEKPIIIGHSLGGTLAIWLASQESLHIDKILIVDGLPAAGAMMIPNYNPDDLVYDNPYSNQQLTMDNDSFAAMATMMSQGMSINPLAQKQISSWIMEADRKTYVYGYTDYLKMDVRENLKQIKAKTTILAAAKPYGIDMVTQNYKTQFKNLDLYDLKIAEQSAHFIMLDDPKWFEQELRQFLK